MKPANSAVLRRMSFQTAAQLTAPVGIDFAYVFRRLKIRFFSLFSVLIATCATGEPVLLNETIVDQKALTFAKGKDTRFATRINAAAHQQDALITFRSYQYVTYYNAARFVCVGRRRLPSGNWEIIELDDHRIKSSNAHRVTSMGICHGDGTIHLAFDNHGSTLSYRISQTGTALNPEKIVWSKNLFGSISSQLGETGQHNRVTYPRFISTPGDDLLLYYRKGGSGSGDGHLYRYDGSLSKWTKGRGKFITKDGNYSGAISKSSDSRNPYLYGISYGGDRLHCSWCWREEPNAATNHSINYAYSDDDGLTWNNSEGDRIAITGESFISVASPGLSIARVPENQGLSNQDAQYAYPDGSFHIIALHRAADPGGRVYHHYSRSAQGDWKAEKLGFGHSRPKLVGSKDQRHLYLVFENRDAIEIAEGKLEAGTMTWVWEKIYRQKDSPAGGDGVVDFALWKLSEVLSILDQEKAKKMLNYGSGKMIDGLPTRLIVRDFRLRIPE